MSDSEYSLPFSEKKQAAFLGYLITDPILFVQAREKIKETMFAHPHHRKIWRWLVEWWAEYKSLPTPNELKEHPKLKVLDVKEAASLVSQIGVCVNARIDYSLPPLRAEVTKWIKVKAYSDGVLKSRAVLEQGLKSVDSAKLEDAYAILAKSLKDIQDANFETEAGISLDPETWAVQATKSTENALTTGNKLLNKLLLEAGTGAGALLPQEMTVVLAPADVGKTTTLITTIVDNVFAEKDVLFLFHEGAQHNILSRIFALATNRTVAEFQRLRVEEPEAVKVVSKFLESHLRVIPIMRTGLAVEDLDPIIRREQDQWAATHGKGFDLVVDDYPAKLTTRMASKGGFEYRHVVRAAYEFFDSLAIEMNLHCLVAQQITREGSKLNSGYKSNSGSGRLLDKEDAAEAWGPIECADNILTLNCSPQDRQLKVMTVYVAKCKNARTGRALVTATDWDRWRTHGRDLPSTYYESNQKVSPAMLLQWLKDYNGVLVPGT